MALRLIRRGVVVSAMILSSSSMALTVDEARHLLTRTGFGATPAEIARLLPMTREQAVDDLLKGLDITEVAPAPAFLSEAPTGYVERLADYIPEGMASQRATAPMSKEASDHLDHLGMQEMAQLRIWWLDQMISTRSPMAERIALFWHGHFTSKYFDVLAPKLMYNQLQLIRQQGTRNFASLLSAMARDPAMLIFLDNAVNTRKAPNENFARELLELFTLGIGNYSEKDIKELARILAGNSVDFGNTWGYVVRRDEVDNGVKTFLGQSGNFNIDDALRIILAQPRTAQFIAEKFYREFVSPQPDVAEIDRLAAVLRGNAYEMRPFLKALLTSENFWSPATRGTLVKSPVELLVGFVRSFGVWLPDGEILNSYSYVLGQELFEPPSVEGWKDGMQWLNPQSIATRTTMLERLWAARAVGEEYLQAGAKDLIVRYSAESSDKQPASFRIKVNGREVYRGQARWASDTTVEGPTRPKPVWEIVSVARNKLPAEIKTIDVVFDKKGSPDMFVNWVQIDGKRMPAYLSEVRFAAHQTCPMDGGGIPTGMLYCVANMHFDLTKNTAAQNVRVATLYDREHGPVNSILEDGTARMQLAMRPGARDPQTITARAADEWLALPGIAAKPEQFFKVASAVEPLQPSALTQNKAALLKAITLDPAYNLK